MKKIFFITLTLFIISAGAVFAHQPQLVNKETIIRVTDPEVSKAYYAELNGDSAIYKISSPADFTLYVNLLVPILKDEENNKNGEKQNLNAIIKKNGVVIKYLSDQENNWPLYYEEFGGDYYYQGPEYETQAGIGDYEIIVSNTNNTGKYVIAIGKEEAFPISEIWRTTKIMPSLKHDYFGKSYFSALNNIFGKYLGISIGVLLILIIIIILIIKKRNKIKQRIGEKLLKDVVSKNKGKGNPHSYV
ncbi:MAG: hypothetical protein WC752_02810 [Patescibacteria group bacterium]|jgi:hypothetical protein